MKSIGIKKVYYSVNSPLGSIEYMVEKINSIQSNHLSWGQNEVKSGRLAL